MKIDIYKLIENVSTKYKNEWDSEYKKIEQSQRMLYTTSLGEKSELKVHKILYFLYGYYGRISGKKLFENAHFESWKFGPVEINYRYSNKLEFIDLNEKEIEILEKIAFDLLKFNTLTLIEFSHITHPWINAGSGKLFHKKISQKDIEEYFGWKNIKEKNGV